MGERCSAHGHNRSHPFWMWQRIPSGSVYARRLDCAPLTGFVFSVDMVVLEHGAPHSERRPGTGRATGRGVDSGPIPWHFFPVEVQRYRQRSEVGDA